MHVSICILAYFLYNDIERRFREKGLRSYPHRCMDRLQKCRVSRLEFKISVRTNNALLNHPGNKRNIFLVPQQVKMVRYNSVNSGICEALSRSLQHYAPTAPQLASDRTSGTAKAVSPQVFCLSPVTLASPGAVSSALQVVPLRTTLRLTIIVPVSTECFNGSRNVESWF